MQFISVKKIIPYSNLWWSQNHFSREDKLNLSKKKLNSKNCIYIYIYFFFFLIIHKIYYVPDFIYYFFICLKKKNIYIYIYILLSHT